MGKMILLCAAVCFLASVIQTVGGFGFGILAMAILPHFILSPTACATMVGIVSAVIAFSVARRYYKRIDRRMTLLPLPSFLIFSYLAVRFSGVARGEVMRHILGWTLIAISLYFLFGSSKLYLKKSLGSALLAGSISGVLSGMFSTGGPPLAAYYMATTKEKEEYLGSIQTFFLFSNLYNTGVRAAHGLVTREVLILSAVGIVVSFAGMYLGRRIITKIDLRQQRSLIYALILISGIMMLI